MKIFPAIDLYQGSAVRLFKGDYNQMTIYSNNPLEIAKDFEQKGAQYLHMVDLEGAKFGNTPNLSVIKNIVQHTDLFVEVGGGIRSMEVVDAYLSGGVNRVILGTAAITDEQFLLKAVDRYKEKIAVGVDMKDGYVAIKGWTEKSSYSCADFCSKMQSIGVQTLICTDISKDGAMKGPNFAFYQQLKEYFQGNIIASGGVSSIENVETLAKMDLYGAIIGKAYYIGAIDLKQAIEVAK